jgi:hypothetical protein
MLVQGNVGRVKKLGVVVRESGRGLNNSPKSQLSEITLRLVTLPLVIPLVVRRSLSRYDALETWQTSKPQNRRALFDVELYFAVHKSFVSTSLNIIHRGHTFYFSYPYWTITSLYVNTMSSITVI